MSASDSLSNNRDVTSHTLSRLTPSELEAIEKRAAVAKKAFMPNNVYEINEIVTDLDALCQEVRRLQQVEQAAQDWATTSDNYRALGDMHDGASLWDKFVAASAALRTALEENT